VQLGVLIDVDYLWLEPFLMKQLEGLIAQTASLPRIENSRMLGRVRSLENRHEVGASKAR